MSIFKKFKRKIFKQNIWARPEMQITFRAEVMPGKTKGERTFRVREVLPNGRVKLHEFVGEHKENAFEPVNFKRNKD